MRTLMLQVLPTSQPPMATTSVFPVQFALTLIRTLWSHALSTQLPAFVESSFQSLYISKTLTFVLSCQFYVYHLKQFNRSTYALKLLRVFWSLFHVQVSKSFKYKYKQPKKIVDSEFLLRLVVLRVLCCSKCVGFFVRAILQWCP